MRTLNVTFTDAEFMKIKKAKRIKEWDLKTSLSWHKYFLTTFTKGVSVKRNGNKKIL